MRENQSFRTSTIPLGPRASVRDVNPTRSQNSTEARASVGSIRPPADSSSWATFSGT